MAAARWAIGIDPGFGETGLVLRRGNKVRAWATLSCPPNGTPYFRTLALAWAVQEILIEWIGKHKVKRLDIGIETPIYKNAHSFELQWRLVQEIESNVVLLNVPELWLTEVGPTASKKLATGNGSASKNAMIAACPFFPNDLGYERETAEAIADAWAHSLAAWGGCPDCKRMPLTNYGNELPDVKEVCRGTRA